MGFKKIILFALLWVCIGCNSAKKCADKYPCTPTKAVIDSTKTVTYTVQRWEELSKMPIIKISCFEHIGKDSIQIFSIPCIDSITKTFVYRTQFILDTAKIVYLSGEVLRLQKDSLRLNQRLIDNENKYDKRYYFYRNGFFFTWGVFFLLALFFLWRKTKKG